MINTDQLMQLSLDMAGMTDTPADSAIYYPGENIKRIIMGIDMGAPELLLGRDLGYDAVIAHHPIGDTARLDFADVLWTHLNQMTAAGVPEDVARPLVEEKMAKAQMGMHAANYDHTPSIAKLIDMPYLNIHLPLDEIGRQMMVESTNKLSPDQPVSALIDQFKTDMKEFRIAMTDFQVRVGSPDNPLGKVAISHAAGTNGGYPIAKAYFDHGVDTVLYIHCSPQDTQKIKEEFEGKGKNLVISGHISSDAVGINVYCDELEKRGLEVTRISGILT